MDKVIQDSFNFLMINPSFFIDINELNSNYEKILSNLHPDNFASSKFMQKEAERISADINDFYASLLNKKSRALLLLTRLGGNIEQLPITPAEFLNKLMEYKIGLPNTKSVIIEQINNLEQEIENSYSGNNLISFEKALQQLMFLWPLIGMDT